MSKACQVAEEHFAHHPSAFVRSEMLGYRRCPVQNSMWLKHARQVPHLGQYEILPLLKGTPNKIFWRQDLLGMKVSQASSDVQRHEMPVLVPAQPPGAGVVMR